jgi:hypothetical protein
MEAGFILDRGHYDAKNVSDELFAELRFIRADIENINGFLKSIRETPWREFEALLEEGLPVLCGDRPIYKSTI